MVKAINLCKDQQCIRIEANEHNWCTCHLIVNNAESIYLGSNSLEYIKGHLIECLREDHIEGTVELAGHNAKWVLTLTDAHHMLYIGDENDGKVFIWLSGEGKEGGVVALLRLSYDECALWIDRLSDFGQ